MKLHPCAGRVAEREIQGRLQWSGPSDRVVHDRRFTNRMAAVMWVIGVLSIVTVVNRIQFTYLE